MGLPESIRSAAHNHCDQIILPRVAAWETTTEYPLRAFSKAAADGLLGLYCPTDLGGEGLTFAEAIPVFEEFGRGSGLYAFSLSMHNTVAYAIAKFGQDAFRDEGCSASLPVRHLVASYLPSHNLDQMHLECERAPRSIPPVEYPKEMGLCYPDTNTVPAASGSKPSGHFVSEL